MEAEKIFFWREKDMQDRREGGLKGDLGKVKAYKPEKGLGFRV